jgi:HEAT repeat protein
MKQPILRAGARARRSPSPAAAACAFLLLALWTGGCAKSDERLLAELDDRDAHVRAFAAFALAVQAPEHASRALPELLETVDRVELELGAEALSALAKIAPRVAGELVAIYCGETLLTAERRRAILLALGRSGEGGVAPILAAVRGPGRARAGELAGALAAIGAPAVRPLEDLLARDPDPWARGYAAWTLGSLGPRARPAVGTLRAALADAHPSVVRRAREALGRIEGTAGLDRAGPAPAAAGAPSEEPPRAR